ncbi:MAG: hypothetical protein NTX00_00600 [Candidatus Parcubacteria bacterium]|nr:hypothetical protein [Candidatus Parcubacteria bacterium]
MKNAESLMCGTKKQEEVMEGIIFGLVLLVLFVALMYGVYKERKEERKTKEREQKRIEEIKSTLSGKNFVVILRRPDKGKTGFESLLMNALISNGAKVLYLLDKECLDIINSKDINAITKVDTFILQGAAWENEPFTYCDYKLRHSSKNEEVLAAGYTQEHNEDILARKILENIVNILKS